MPAPACGRMGAVSALSLNGVGIEVYDAGASWESHRANPFDQSNQRITERVRHLRITFAQSPYTSFEAAPSQSKKDTELLGVCDGARVQDVLFFMDGSRGCSQ